MGILSLVLQCSFLPIQVDPVDVPDLEVPMFVTQAGTGNRSVSGDRLTLNFTIQDVNGKEIANSERRGIPHSFDLLGPNSEPLLQAAGFGARLGEERWVLLNAEEWCTEVSPLGLVRNPGPLWVRIKVEQLLRR